MPITTLSASSPSIPHQTSSCPPIPSRWQQVWSAAKEVFKVLGSIFLYWLNPTLFAAGYIVGIIKNQDVSQSLQQIQDIFELHSWDLIAVIGLGAFMSLPVTLGAGSLLVGAHWGSGLSNETQRLKRLASVEDVKKANLECQV